MDVYSEFFLRLESNSPLLKNIFVSKEFHLKNTKRTSVLDLDLDLFHIPNFTWHQYYLVNYYVIEISLRCSLRDKKDLTTYENN